LITVLGWGSLIWDPRELRLDGKWHRDGPMLPVEFARISSYGWLTLVIHPGSADVRTLWANMSSKDLNEAIDELAKREGTSMHCIGFADATNGRAASRFPSDITQRISSWMAGRPIGAVIWTDLPSNFEAKRDLDFDEVHVVEYLRTLRGKAKTKAREYVTRAPRQVSTVIRGVIESQFGWHCEADEGLLEGQP